MYLYHYVEPVQISTLHALVQHTAVDVTDARYFLPRELPTRIFEHSRRGDEDFRPPPDTI